MERRQSKNVNSRFCGNERESKWNESKTKSKEIFYKEELNVYVEIDKISYTRETDIEATPSRHTLLKLLDYRSGKALGLLVKNTKSISK